MTTIDAVPTAADFPITWDDPADEQAAWFQDVMHSPLPMTPLTATLFEPAFAEGASRQIAQLMLPVDALNVSMQNGYVYLSSHPISDDPAVIEARLLEAQHVTMELAPTVLEDWRKTFEPDVLARAKRILAFAAERRSVAETARFIVGLRSDFVDVWDIHMRVNIPPMSACFALEDMVTAVLGEQAVPEALALLQGFDNKSVETGRAMWALSRWVRTDESLAQAVLGARARSGKVEMEPTPQTAEFERRWRAFLDVYGWRSDVFFELGHKSWHDEPSTPLTQMKGYVGMGDEQDPFGAHARYAAKRDELTAQFEARLPDEVKPDFRALLQMAQQYVPIAEDHNFTIDQKFTAVVRQGVLQLGHRLVEEGALSDPEDVFYLTYDETRSLADGGATSELGARVRQRRREHARQASLKAPLTIGTPPPADSPPDPIVTRFFGVGLVPSEDVNVVTGHACSTGVVTGIARIVPTLDDAAKLQPGDILVCRMTMPAWTPLFGVAGAVVADSGGPLSHCAIVAREYGIPCVAGTVNGTAVLRDGMRVRVDGGTGIVTVLTEKTRG